MSEEQLEEAKKWADNGVANGFATHEKLIEGIKRYDLLNNERQKYFKYIWRLFHGNVVK